MKMYQLMTNNEKEIIIIDIESIKSLTYNAEDPNTVLVSLSNGKEFSVNGESLALALNHAEINMMLFEKAEAGEPAQEEAEPVAGEAEDSVTSFIK